MDDRVDVVQQPVYIAVRNKGAVSQAVTAVNIPEPPQGCESQQLMDFAATVGLFNDSSKDVGLKARTAESYADRHGITVKIVEVVQGMTFPPTESG